MKNKLLVIVGPTASGKSDLATDLAQNFGGEVISADSRQVYRGLDIATGKVTQEEMRGVPHHLLDVVEPQKRFTVADYKKLADEAITYIYNRNHLPILAGGTGFYIQAVVDNLALPDVPANHKLRKELKEKSVEELFTLLKEKDSRRANSIDANNPRRLIRALEIADKIGGVPKLNKKMPFDTLQIGLEPSKTELTERIEERTNNRLKKGMIKEAQELHADGLSFDRMHQLGLEYRYLAEFLQNKISKDELRKKIIQGDFQYAKRQFTWFKKDERIEWFTPSQEIDIKKRVQSWVNKG